jgi:prepilin-type N-terminal cleavage/methylation domain-containing protein
MTERPENRTPCNAAGIERGGLSGFTLIELLTAIAIVAVLAAIAIPAYTRYVVRSHLTEGMDTLSAYQVQMEHYYQDSGNYGVSPACGGGVIALPVNTQYFTYACTTTGQTYTATASGIGRVVGYTYTVDDSATPRKTTRLSGSAVNKTCWATQASDC